MANRGTEKRALSGQILVRLPAVTATHIASLAAADDLTAAAWARRVLVAAAGCDPADAVPVRARTLPSPPRPAHVMEMVRLREVVAEMSGALVQAAIMARTDGARMLHAEIEAVLPGVRAAVRDLDALKLSALGRR